MLIKLARLFRLSLPFIVLGLAACGGSSTPIATHSVGGTLVGLLPDNKITLTNNGIDTLTISANGAFTFSTKLTEAAKYSITLTGPTPIAQTCTTTNGTGSVNATSPTAVKVSCEVNVVATGQVDAKASEVVPVTTEKVDTKAREVTAVSTKKVEIKAAEIKVVSAGLVESTAGEVQASSIAGKQRALHQGDTINEGDTLRSGSKAMAMIKMGDGGMITMRPDTEFKIDSYSFNGKQDGTEKSFFSLFKGGFRSVTGLIGKMHKESYRIKTTNATLGIRGTDHETYLVLAGTEAAKLSPVGTYDTVYSGATSLTNDKGTIVIEPKQMGYVAAPDQKPKLQPIDTKLFVPVAEPVTQKPAAQPAPPVEKAVVPSPLPIEKATVSTPAVAVSAPVVPKPAKVEYTFDGRWVTKLVCDNTYNKKGEFIKGFIKVLDVTIDHGKLNGQEGELGKPGSNTFTGEVNSDGKIEITVSGFVGGYGYDLGKLERGAPFRPYHLEGLLAGSTGQATRTEGRPCQATLTKL